MNPDDIDPQLLRYSRQILFDGIGVEGQRRLRSARAVLVGCGAIGSVQADVLVRAGVGALRICDRDFVERDNLQRQMLFDEEDATADLPKAEAAARRLRRINSDVCIEAVACDVNHANIEQLADGFDLLLDGTDNFETRFLLNDLSVKTNRPWVYGAVVGSGGLSMAVAPGRTPCLRCLFPEAPPPDVSPTCDTAGVIAPAVHLVGALQAMEALKILTGRTDHLHGRLVEVDLWTGRFAAIDVSRAKQKDCPCCGRRSFPFLSGERASSTTTLCGRNAVQVRPAGAAGTLDFDRIAERLAAVASGPLTQNPFLLRATIEGREIVLFRDGRAIIRGTEDEREARSFYAKYVGA